MTVEREVPTGKDTTFLHVKVSVEENAQMKSLMLSSPEV